MLALCYHNYSLPVLTFDHLWQLFDYGNCGRSHYLSMGIASSRPQIIPTLTIWGLITVIAARIIFGLTARVFATLIHQISDYFKAKIDSPLRPLIGGILIVMAIKLFGVATGSYAVIACVLPYLCSGHTGIYRSQQGKNIDVM
jgi:hypothetical protein